MQWLINLVLYKTIIGAVAVATVVYVITRWITRGETLPFAVAAVAFFGMLVIVTSEPRYRFERETRAALAAAPWTRVMSETRWGAIIEPRTWFQTPVGHFVVVQPDPESVLHPPPEGEESLQVITVAYEQQPTMSLATVFCDDGTATWASPDRTGVLRYETNAPQPLPDDQRELFCETDWASARRLMREQARPQLEVSGE